LYRDISMHALEDDDAISAAPQRSIDSFASPRQHLSYIHTIFTMSHDVRKMGKLLGEMPFGLFRNCMHNLLAAVLLSFLQTRCQTLSEFC
jgi:hypothetical protein